MSSRNVSLADAIVTALNTAAQASGAFSQSFTALRRLLNLNDLEALKVGDDPLVVVDPKQDKHFPGTRGQRRHEMMQYVCIAKRIEITTDPKSSADSSELDDLIAFGEEIADWFVPDTTIAGFNLIDVDHEPIYDEKTLREDRMFLTNIALKFQTFA